MKYLILVMLALALVVGCGASAPTPTPAAKLVVPWGAGDRAEYTIEMDGKTLGALVFTTQRKDDGYVVMTETSAGEVKDVSNVRVDKDLKPIGNTRQITGAGKADFTLMTVYDKGKLTIQAKTADGDKSATIDAPADSWDNDQSLVSIRALPLAEGYQFTYTNIVGASATALKTKITVLSKEQVTVPAGSFTAYKVEMDFGQGKNYAWYDVNPPHHIVKYENSPAKQIIVLTKVGTP
jgi:tRNA splicing ligase